MPTCVPDVMVFANNANLKLHIISKSVSKIVWLTECYKESIKTGIIITFAIIGNYWW